MSVVEALAELTARTPSGGGFWIGSDYCVVRYCSDSWEWEYRSNIFYDLQDLADEVQKAGDEGLMSLSRQRITSVPDQTSGWEFHSPYKV